MAVLIESWLFLREEMSMQQLVSFVVILFGALIAAVESEKKRRRDSFLGLALMIIGINLGAVTYILSKYLMRAGLEGDRGLLHEPGGHVDHRGHSSLHRIGEKAMGITYKG